MPYIPVLHSVSYAGAWPGHSLLDVDSFLRKAADLGFRSVALVAKRPHVSPFDYDAAARRALKGRLRELGLELAALMGGFEGLGNLPTDGQGFLDGQSPIAGRTSRGAASWQRPRR